MVVNAEIKILFFYLFDLSFYSIVNLSLIRHLFERKQFILTCFFLLHKPNKIYVNIFGDFEKLEQLICQSIKPYQNLRHNYKSLVALVQTSSKSLMFHLRTSWIIGGSLADGRASLLVA